MAEGIARDDRPLVGKPAPAVLTQTHKLALVLVVAVGGVEDPVAFVNLPVVGGPEFGQPCGYFRRRVDGQLAFNF